MDLQTIRTKARQKLDETSAKFWSDDELNNYINQGYYFYWNQAIREQYFLTLKATTLDIVAGTAEIALPSDYLQARLVEKVFTDRTVPLQYQERFMESNGTSTGLTNRTLFTYAYVGSNLVLQPTPQTSETGGIKLTYFYRPALLSDDTDEPVIDPFYQDLLVLYCVVEAKQKEEAIANTGADLAPFVMTLRNLEQSYKEMIEQSTIQPSYVRPYSAM